MKKRIMCLITVTVLLFSLLLSGCSNSNPKDTADAMCSLIFKYKLEDGEKLGITKDDEEEILKEYQDEIKNQFKQNLTMIGYEPTDSELDSIGDAYKEALAKISYDSKEVSKSGDEAEVEISTNNIDMKDIDEKAAMAALDETEGMQFKTSKEESDNYAKVYIGKIAENLKNAEVSSDKSSNTFKFRKVDKVWVPDNPKEFGFKLIRLVTDKENSDLSMDEEIATPEESAEALWNLVIKQDSSSMDKLGYSKAFGERIIKNIQKNDFDEFKSEFSNSNLNLSDEQLKKMIDSLEQKIAQNTVKFEETYKSNNSAQVKVTSTSIDLTSIINKTIELTQSQAIASGMTSQDQIMEAYINNLVTAIQDAEITSKENNKTFQFTKTGDIWMPSNTEAYTAGIGELTMK